MILQIYRSDVLKHFTFHQLSPVFVTRTHILQSGLTLIQNRRHKRCLKSLKMAVFQSIFDRKGGKIWREEVPRITGSLFLQDHRPDSSVSSSPPSLPALTSFQGIPPLSSALSPSHCFHIPAFS